MNRLLLRISLISFVFFSCKQPPPPPTPPPSVNLYTVMPQPVLYFDKYQATVQALSQVSIMPQVQGYITGIFFSDGSLVHKGQVLYEIDRRLYQAAVDAAAANLQVAKGNTKQAQQDADRYEYLNSYNAVAKQVYDHAVIALQNAKNQEKAAEEALKTANTNLTYSIITAPFDGTVGFSQVKLGNLVSPGTILNTISTNDPMAVDFLINEKQLPFFEKIKAGKTPRKDSLFSILMPDNSSYPYQGRISVIDRAVDAQTGSITVRLVFPNPKTDLKVGMSCVVQVRNQEVTPQMLIPGKAVVEQMGEYFVYVAKDTVMAAADSSAGKGDKADKDKTDNSSKTADTAAHKGPKLYAFQKKVQIGQTIGANVIVLSGIKKGDKIVVDGIQAIHDGSQISAGKKVPGLGAGPGNAGPAKPDSSKN